MFHQWTNFIVLNVNRTNRFNGQVGSSGSSTNGCIQPPGVDLSISWDSDITTVDGEIQIFQVVVLRVRYLEITIRREHCTSQIDVSLISPLGQLNCAWGWETIWTICVEFILCTHYPKDRTVARRWQDQQVVLEVRRFRISSWTERTLQETACSYRIPQEPLFQFSRNIQDARNLNRCNCWRPISWYHVTQTDFHEQIANGYLTTRGMEVIVGDVFCDQWRE